MEKVYTNNKKNLEKSRVPSDNGILFSTKGNSEKSPLRDLRCTGLSESRRSEWSPHSGTLTTGSSEKGKTTGTAEGRMNRSSRGDLQHSETMLHGSIW